LSIGQKDMSNWDHKKQIGKPDVKKPEICVGCGRNVCNYGWTNGGRSCVCGHLFTEHEKGNKDLGDEIFSKDY